MTRMKMKILAARMLRPLGEFFRTKPKWIALSALLLLAAIAVSCSMFTCDGQSGPGTPPVITPGVSGVPLIRVKLTRAAEPVIATTGGYNVYCDGRLVAQSGLAMPPVAVCRAGRTWTIGNQSFTGDAVEVQVSAAALTRYGLTYYRGNLRLVPTGEGQYAVVNCLDLESYLAGVLPKELLTSWGDETYKALAVAARTFARYQCVTFGASSYYDVTDDQASQVYGGYTAEKPRSRAAVSSTCGQMLHAGAPGHETLFLAQYSACCGGVVNGAIVLRNVQPLAAWAGGQVCEDCANCARYRWPPVRVAKADVYKAVSAAYPAGAALGQVTDVRVVSCTNYGRVL